MTRLARPLILLGLLTATVLQGCVERTISITSEPPGAIVWLNDVEIGRTPVETGFTFYGTYDVRLRLEGHDPILASRTASAPVYDFPAIDLLAEAVPAKIESKIDWHFVLTPTPERAEGADQDALRQQLIERAKELRNDPAGAEPVPPAETK